MFDPLKTLWVKLNTPPDITCLLEKLDAQDAAAETLKEVAEDGKGRALASLTEGKGE